MSSPIRKFACLCALWGGFGGGLHGAAADTGFEALGVPSDGLILDYGPIMPESIALANTAPAPVSQRAITDGTTVRAADGAADGPFGNANRVSGETLASMRGAWDSASGIRISFGIERAVYIDGALVTSTSLNIANVGRMTSEQAGLLGAAGEAVMLVQSGSGNAAALAIAGPFAAATVIQNTLNNRQISITTTIDAATDGLRLLKDLNLGTALRDALNLPIKSQ